MCALGWSEMPLASVLFERSGVADRARLAYRLACWALVCLRTTRGGLDACPGSKFVGHKETTMREYRWPQAYRRWIEGLPEQLGPRKVRLLAGAWCRDLLVERLKKGGAAPALSAVLEALDASDRFADTGKTKSALMECLRRLKRRRTDNEWPFFSAPAMMESLVSEEPDKTLRFCGMSMQWLEGASLWNELIAVLRRKTLSAPLDRFMPRLRGWVDDMTKPKGDAAMIDDASRTSEVVELAEAICQDQQFHRMPELADLLERVGCTNQVVVKHCRAAHAEHIRGCWVLDEILGELIAKPRKRDRPPGSLKRHQILKRELHETLEVTLQLLDSNEAKRGERTAPGKPQQQFDREMQLSGIVSCAVLEHLGYGPIERLESRLQTGVDLALEYFFGDWWVGDDDDSIALDKSRPDRELRWLGVLPYGLLLAGLTQRWADVEKLSSWVDSSIQLEHRFELNDYEYQWLYLCIASELRPDPLDGIDETLNALRECRPKHPRNLCAAWEAAISSDQKAFDKAFKASVRSFLRTHAEDVPNVNFWVGLPESLIWIVAERNGLEFPELDDKLDAAIVRRETIGLAEL